MADAKSKIGRILEKQALHGAPFGGFRMGIASTHEDIFDEEEEASSGEEMVTSPSPNKVSASSYGVPRPVRGGVPGLTRAEIEEQQREVCRELQGLTEMFAHVGTTSTPVHAPVSSHPNVSPSDLFLSLDDDEDDDQDEMGGEEGSDGDDGNGEYAPHEASEREAEEENQEEPCVTEEQLPVASEAHAGRDDGLAHIYRPSQPQSYTFTEFLSADLDTTVRSQTPSLRPATPSSVGSASPVSVRPATPSVDDGTIIEHNSPAAEIEAKFIQPANTATRSAAAGALANEGGSRSETEAESESDASSAAHLDLVSSPAPASPVVNGKEGNKQAMLNSATMRLISYSSSSSSERPICADDDSDSVIFGTPEPVVTKVCVLSQCSCNCPRVHCTIVVLVGLKLMTRLHEGLLFCFLELFCVRAR